MDRDRDRAPRDRDRDERPDRQNDIVGLIAALNAKIDTLTGTVSSTAAAAAKEFASFRRRYNTVSQRTDTDLQRLDDKVTQVFAWAHEEEEALRAQLAAAEEAATTARAEADAASADDAADDLAVAAAEDRATTAEGVAAALQETVTGFDERFAAKMAPIEAKVDAFGLTAQPAPAPEVPA